VSTTTIRLTDELKARVQKAAQAHGLTAHALILEAIKEKATSSELRMAFYDTAEARLARLAESGESVSWDDMRDYLRARIKGDRAEPPAARKLMNPRD